MKMNKLSILGLVAGLFLFMAGDTKITRAEETAGEKVQNTTDDVVRGTKKTGRKAKKKVRDATGNRSRKEDAKDRMRNAGDEVEDSAKEVKRKVD